VVALLVASLCFDEGEVVTLMTVDSRGNHYETSLWIVDLEGVPFLRAESPSASWLGRIREFPDVKLDRAGRRTDQRAIPIDDEKVREDVRRAMAKKYGIFDRVSQWFRDYSHSVPIQLQNLPAPEQSAGVSP
jgi:hypothetical protein